MTMDYRPKDHFCIQHAGHWTDDYAPPDYSLPLLVPLYFPVPNSLLCFRASALSRFRDFMSFNPGNLSTDHTDKPGWFICRSLLASDQGPPVGEDPESLASKLLQMNPTFRD
jgi:hypothetical protein